MMHRLLFVVWSVAFLLLLAVTGANGLYVLELVQVAHRSGVEPPPADAPNRTKQCSPNGTTDCAAMANYGAQQLKAMGTYIRQLYSDDAQITNSATWLGSTYDPTAVRSRAFADPATAQAATALLSGIYASPGESITPAIISTAPDLDTLLNVEAIPSFAIANELNAAALNKELAKVVDEQFPDPQSLPAMGAEVGLDAICSDSSRRVLCCDRLQRLATMYTAMGTAGAAPTLAAHAAQLDAVAAARHRALYGYNATQSTGAARGSLGQTLAQEMLKNMRRKMLLEGNNGHNTHRVMHYAHNIPIDTALGYSPETKTPLAETFLLDLLRDEGTGAFFVRLRYGNVAPAASPEAVPAVAAALFPFRCLSAANVPTDATTSDGLICPFDDFARFVDSSKGTDAAGGVCYLDEDTKSEFGCNVEGAAPSEKCAGYRAMCPAQACPSGFVFSVADGSCKHIDIVKDVISNGPAVAVGIVSVFCGFVLSFVIMHICPMFFLKNAKKSANSDFLSPQSPLTETGAVEENGKGVRETVNEREKATEENDNEFTRRGS
ncbi:putative membrane-bound acid phosphatase [Trypanosoma theileri]|uniref:Putative membrane-bound acid phosphatase n=1 Tax=Trypanosoma theileri TaxID=67003 RepID=A0A1X0NQL4_9TRYP|nr:putative membrane-bound acid phosphatase [Trypanosoma theileri]ORC87015.1 putative membrane-bound acid phosphatase [Trypanosoma theileri]